MEALIAVCIVQAAALLAILTNRLLGQREIKTVQSGDYKDAPARAFQAVKLLVATDGVYLADGRTGRPLVFTGVTSSQVQTRHLAGDCRGRAVVLLEGLEVKHAPAR